MHYRLSTLILATLLIIPMGSFAWAGELNGLQIESQNHHINLLLDMKQPQAYKIEQSSRPDTKTIILPQANLPEAFQDTGLPNINNPALGVSASIQQGAEGVRIRLHGSPRKLSQIEVRFAASSNNEAPTPKSPLALTQPEKQDVPGLFSQVKQQINQQRPSVVLRKARTVRIAHKPSLKVAVAPKPEVKPEEKQENQQKPQAVQTREQGKAETTQPVAQAPKLEVASSDEEEGYNLLEHAQEHQEMPPTGQPTAPNANVFPSKQYMPQQPVPHTPAHRSLLGAIIRWILVSTALLLGLIALAIGFAIWLKRRKTVQEPFLEGKPIPLEEYFETPPVMTTPQPETYLDYLKEEKPRAKKAAKVTAPQTKPVSPIKPTLRSNETKPKAEVPPVAKKPQKYPTETYLIPPIHSVSEAVKTSLGSKANPYVSAPFQILKKPKPVQPQGGPKVKNNNTIMHPSAHTSPKAFNQFLNS